MKTPKRLTCLPAILALSLSLSLVLTQTVLAEQSMPTEDATTARQPWEHKFELAQNYYAECKHVEKDDFAEIRPYLRAFTDVEVMAEMMSDPAKAARLGEIVADPRTLHVMMKCSMEPVMWDTWMRGLSDPYKMARAAGRFMNPGVYMVWMMAPMNPAIHQSMMRMGSPDMYARWGTAMMNSTFYQPVFMFADPTFYTPRMSWMMNPASFQPMYQMWSWNPTAVPGQ